MNKSKLSVILRILVSLSLLILLLWMARENFAKIWHLLSSLDIFKCILAFLIYLSGLVFIAYRLKVVLAVQGHNFNIRDLFSLTLIGYFFTNFMPTSVGGDLVKGYYISKRTKTKLGSYTSIFIDRIIGMFSLALIASIALAITREEIKNNFIFWAIITLLSVCIIFILLLFNKELSKRVGNGLGIVHLLRIFKIESLAKKIYDTMNIYRSYKKRVLQTFGLSLTAQFISIFAVFLLSRSLSLNIPFREILLVMPVIAALCMLPITINGLGLREWAFVLFFGSSIGPAAALSLSLLYLAMFLLGSVIGGIIYLFWR